MDMRCASTAGCKVILSNAGCKVILSHGGCKVILSNAGCKVILSHVVRLFFLGGFLEVFCNFLFSQVRGAQHRHGKWHSHFPRRCCAPPAGLGFPLCL